MICTYFRVPLRIPKFITKTKKAIKTIDIAWHTRPTSSQMDRLQKIIWNLPTAFLQLTVRGMRQKHPTIPLPKPVTSVVTTAITVGVWATK